MNSVVRVWDAPTRLFHWALVACFIGLIASSQIGGSAMVWHFRFGYAVLTLLLFRLFWGFLGGYWSRFSSFFYSPSQVIGYLQGREDLKNQLGHNPLGSISVFAMLLFLAAQVTSGLMSDDEIASAGPLVRYVSSVWVTNATFYHKEIGKLFLLLLVISHLCAISFYFFKKHENLVRPMIIGDKTVTTKALHSSDTISDRAKAGFILLICASIVSGLVTWLG